MKLELAREVLACLPKGRTLYHYTKDDYAFFLLKKWSEKENKIHKLKETGARKLLDKPAIKPYLASCFNGEIDPNGIPSQQYTRHGRSYRLSLDIWGEDHRYWKMNQVSRRGVSLVLQLNLNNQHRTGLSSCMQVGKRNPFRGYGHPVRDGDYPTLSWCRLDIDLDKREVLIEEIQSDLLRDMRTVFLKAKEEKSEGNSEFQYCGAKFDTARFIRFWNAEFLGHEKTWSEATLSAALWFLIQELGMKMIYYHTFESGNYLKGISYQCPPKSLYTKLPKQFCFEETKEIPALLKTEKQWGQREKRANHALKFFRLEV